MKPRKNLPATSGEVIKSQLRLPADLHERLVSATRASGRSMNAEIVYRLERSFQSLDIGGPLPAPPDSLDDPDAILARLVIGVVRELKKESANEDGSVATIGETLKRIRNRNKKVDP